MLRRDCDCAGSGFLWGQHDLVGSADRQSPNGRHLGPRRRRPSTIARQRSTRARGAPSSAPTRRPASHMGCPQIPRSNGGYTDAWPPAGAITNAENGAVPAGLRRESSDLSAYGRSRDTIGTVLRNPNRQAAACNTSRGRSNVMPSGVRVTLRSMRIGYGRVSTRDQQPVPARCAPSCQLRRDLHRHRVRQARAAPRAR